MPFFDTIVTFCIVQYQDSIIFPSTGQSFLHELAPAGTYNGQFKLKAEPDPDCDPTQGPCEQWLPGDYTVKIGMGLFSFNFQ